MSDTRGDLDLLAGICPWCKSYDCAGDCFRADLERQRRDAVLRRDRNRAERQIEKGWDVR